MPARSRPMPAVRGERPAASRSRSKGREDATARALESGARRHHRRCGRSPPRGYPSRTSTPSPPQSLGDQGARVRLLARKQSFAELDERHLGAEPAERLCELAADRAAAEHREPPGQLAHAPRSSRWSRRRRSSRSRPSIGGVAGSDPVATIAARKRRRCPSTSIVRASRKAPWPVDHHDAGRCAGAQVSPRARSSRWSRGPAPSPRRSRSPGRPAAARGRQRCASGAPAARWRSASCSARSPSRGNRRPSWLARSGRPGRRPSRRRTPRPAPPCRRRGRRGHRCDHRHRSCRRSLTSPSWPKPTPAPS